MNMKKDKLDGQLCLFDYTEPGLPQISELENGEYYAFHYDWIFELYDGTKYHMPYGVDRNKKESNLLRYEVIDGNIKPLKHLICSRIKTPDGTILTSRHRHDFVQHYDVLADDTYFIDGGGDYFRTTVNKIPSSNVSIYSTSPFELIRENMYRGTFDKDGDRIWKPISKCSNEHLKNILTYNEEHGVSDVYYTWVIERELEYREDNKIIITDNWKKQND